MPRQRGLPGLGYAGPARGEAVPHRCRAQRVMASGILEHLPEALTSFGGLGCMVPDRALANRPCAAVVVKTIRPPRFAAAINAGPAGV